MDFYILLKLALVLGTCGRSTLGQSTSTDDTSPIPSTASHKTTHSTTVGARSVRTTVDDTQHTATVETSSMHTITNTNKTTNTTTVDAISLPNTTTTTAHKTGFITNVEASSVPTTVVHDTTHSTTTIPAIPVTSRTTYTTTFWATLIPTSTTNKPTNATTVGASSMHTTTVVLTSGIFANNTTDTSMSTGASTELSTNVSTEASTELTTNVTTTLSTDVSTEVTKDLSTTLPTDYPKSVPTYSLSISSNTSSPVEGEAVRLICSVTPKTDLISWNQDGITLSNSTRKYITYGCSNISCNSTLYVLNTISLTDKGNYSCKVNDQSSEAYMLTVFQKPTLRIRPEPTSVMKNDNVSVTCSISNYDKIDSSVARNFTWCPEELIHTILEENQYKMKISLSVENAHDITVSCGIGTCTQSATINVYAQADTTCKTDEENEITWYTAKTGTTVMQDCPEGYIGKATRLCNDHGSWGKSDISACESEKLHEVTETLQKLQNTEVDAAGLNSLLDGVNAFVTSSGSEKGELEQNNVVKSAEILNEISSANFTITDAKQANATAQSFVGTADNLLKDDKTESLQDENKKKATAKNIIRSFDNFGEKLSKGIGENEPISITKSNIVVLIQKIQPKNVEFPDPRNPNKNSEDTTKLTLAESTLQNLEKVQNKNGKGIAFTAVKYTSLGSLLDSFSTNTNSKNRSVNSDILSLSIHGVDTSKLDPPVNFKFKNSPTNVSRYVLNCSYLNLAKSQWEFDGCRTERSNTDGVTQCSCFHLTNFAILLSPVDTPEEEYERLRLISLVGCSLSIAGGVLTIAVYFHFWRYVKNRRSVLVVNLCFALTGAYLLFLMAVEHSENKVACIAIAALLHYLFLSMFCLMLSIGIDLAIAILQVYKSRSSSLSLLLLGWGAPLVIVAITMGSTKLEGYGDERFCWLRQNTLYGFIVPVVTIITINIIIVIAVMRRMYSASVMAKKSTKQKAISGVRSMAALLPVLGLTWIFGVLSVNSDMVFFQYLFSIFNSIQGLFVFVFHCIFNISIRKAFHHRVRQFDNSRLQKTSKEKLVSKSSNDIKGHSDEMVDADLNLNQDPPKSVYAIPRSKVLIGNRHRPTQYGESVYNFSDNLSVYSPRNTYL